MPTPSPSSRSFPAASTSARRWSRRTALASVLALSVPSAVSCGRDETRIGEQPDGAITTPEQNEDGNIRIDSAGMVARLEGAQVHVGIPVRGLAGGTGALDVSIRNVDDTQVFSSVDIDYAIQAGEDQTLDVVLALPAAAADQAALVAYNVVVRSGDVLRVGRSLQHVVPPHEVFVEGPSRLTAGKQVSYRVMARDAVTRAPLRGQNVELALAAPSGATDLRTLTTDETGTATLELSAAEAGEYSASVRTQAFGVTAAVEEGVTVVAPERRVLLTTDKPIYKPGQTIHVRALSLAASDRRPNANEALTLEIEDGRGNKILKKELTTDAHGIAASDFTLGSILNQGTFKVRVSSGAFTGEKTVEVYEYALPKFEVGVRPDRDWYLAGQPVVADIDARYFFGKPVSDAAVTVELGAIVAGEVLFDRVQSRCDAEGRLRVDLQLPAALPGLPINGGNALAFLRVTATDSAGQSVSRERTLTVASAALDISLVPESGRLVPGLDNTLDLFVSDPLGAPVPNAAAALTLAGEQRSVVTDRFGHARVSWRPESGHTGAYVEVTAGGESTVQTFAFEEQGGAAHVIVRTDRAVYAAGEDVNVEILTTDDGPVYVDWLHEGQAVDMRTLTATGGVARFTLPLDATLLGENRVSAYVVDDAGNIARAGRTLFARESSDLKIAMTSDRPVYTPGAPARLSFKVTDESGAPQVAALGVQIVDEAVFALSDAQPGLLKTYFQLEDEFARPSYEIHAPGGDLASLLLDQASADDIPARDAAQIRAAANLAALGSAPITGLSSGSWARTVQQSRALLEPFITARKASLTSGLTRAARRGIEALADEGCRSRDYYCGGLQLDFWTALGARIAESFVAYDFWGNRYVMQPTMYGEAARLGSAGPDERIGTLDDFAISVRYDELEIAELARADADFNAAPGANFGAPPPAPEGPRPLNGEVDDPSAPASGNAAGPRLRQDFPETLYVNPALITDANGEASIDLELADSITEWRVSALANTAGGRLGGAQSGVTVFQDFFVDVNFPATLTRGDEVDFPIAVYNYLESPQTVELELAPADWYTPLGSTRLSLQLEAGEVRGVSLPVRVEDVGLQTLTLTGTSAGGSDAVARRVRVVPDGKAFPTAVSGSLEPGSVAHTLEFPADAVPGSEQLFINVYPAFMAQAVSGMDSVLQVPSGCFEQTTSTTWPNVLVTDYMRATRQITPEVALRAESLISAGYQRLLTFEHPGGGFSWFGTQDPAPYLSVTAFGLMEFADMKAVHPIDEVMLERTQSWLVSQQAGDGSWQGDQSEFFSFHTSLVRNTAFVLWALAENGYDGPATDRGIAYVKQALASADPSEKDDPYTLALVANAFVLLRDSEASAVLERLDAMKREDGDKFSWTTALQTSFYGGGNDADVTATALVTHAMLRANAHPATVQGALAFITAAKDAAGNFGSTQATTWSLKTLVLAARRGTDGATGTLNVSVDGAPFSTLELRADQSDVMTTIDMSALASTGQHEVELSFLGTGQLSYNLVASHHRPWSALPPEPAGPLAIEVAYDNTSLAVNDRVRATATIQNLTASSANMVLVTLGVPPGFEVQLGDLQPYLDAGVLSRAEVTGKQLILYVSALAPNQTQSFEYSLLATLPVRASDGGAEVSLYYEPEQKSQAPATTLVVTEP